MTRHQRRLRVLHVIQNLNYGGMERLLADIVRRCDPEEFESHVLVLQYLGRFSRELEGRAALHQSPPLSRWSMLRPRLLARQIAAISPDVVHTHSGVWFKASRGARLARVPRVVHTEHGRGVPDPLLFRMLDGLASRRTDLVVAVSEALAAQLDRTVVRGRSPITVVHNAVDTALFRPARDDGGIRSELGIPRQAPVIGSIGRLEPIKGYDVAIRAFARLIHAGGNGPHPAHLILAGDGSERLRLSTMVADLALEGRVHLMGWRDDIHELLSCFSLFTMSSHSEGTSVSLLEAMSSGLCPVVTRVGGNAAVLGDSLRHRLVTPGDAGALAESWREVLADPSRRAADAGAARARVLEAYDLDAMVRRYEQVYRGENDPTG